MMKEVLVPRSSATLDRVEAIMTETDHFNMNKFKSRTDDGYCTFLSKMEEFTTEDSYHMHYTKRRDKLLQKNPTLAWRPTQKHSKSYNMHKTNVGMCPFLIPFGLMSVSAHIYKCVIILCVNIMQQLQCIKH